MRLKPRAIKADLINARASQQQRPAARHNPSELDQPGWPSNSGNEDEPIAVGLVLRTGGSIDLCLQHLKIRNVVDIFPNDAATVRLIEQQVK